MNEFTGILRVAKSHWHWTPGQYIVDQIPESPSISIDIPEVNNIYSELQKYAVIGRFNGFWPRANVLYQWIHSFWTKNCQIYLYPKGFFIVCFHTEEKKETVLNQGPWFWGSARLFITPWFPWCQHHLPLHFWHSKALTAIQKYPGENAKDRRRETFKRNFYLCQNMCRGR